MKKFIKVPVVACALLLLCACGKEATTQTETSETPGTTAPTTLQYNISTEVVTQQAFVPTPETSMTYAETQPSTETPVATEVQDTQTSQTETLQTETTQQLPVITESETATQTTEKVYEKTGDMAFSDSPDNKYINAIVTKYGVDSKTLVALYTVPDNDGNIVLQFDGSTDESGKLIRNENTLVAIYSIDKNLNSKRACEDSSLNEYSYGEMKVMFISTTKYIMPEFQNELNG